MRSSIMFMILVLLFTIVFGQTWKERKDSHFENLAATNGFSLSNANYFANTLQDEDNFRKHLEKILIVRTIGSPGHDKVRGHLVESMKSLGWYVEEQRFNSPTPHGNKNFTNVIATLNPDAPRRLVLACHYDSKIEPIGFLGATDSAVPCAQMINLAHTLRNDLQKNKNSDLSLQFLFFDGEEAFVNWNNKDSIYGSRHLAQNWQKERFSFGNAVGNTLDRIDLFVLLDLLGTKSPKIYNYFTQTSSWFALMQHIEDTLASHHYLTTRDRIFGDRQGNFGIEDDHIPFLRRGVPILHLIPVPFPKVWHTIDDNFQAIDFNTVGDLNKILRLFVATYLNIT